MFVSIRSPQALRFSSLTSLSTPPHTVPPLSGGAPDFTKLHFPEWLLQSSIGKPGSLHYPREADWRAIPCPKQDRREGGAWTSVSFPYTVTEDLP
jgi:hypothetical protein